MKQILFLVAILACLTIASLNSAFAHNQSPSTIRRSLESGFNSLKSPLPNNVFRGDKSVKINGNVVQIFHAKKEGLNTGNVAQTEYQEVIYVMAFDTNGSLVFVSREHIPLTPEESQSLPFLEPLKQYFHVKK